MPTIGPAGRSAWHVEGGVVDLTRARPAPRRLALEARPQPIVLDAGRCALVVIDMQNDFLHRSGWLAHIGVDVTPARSPIPTLKALLPPLRAAGVPVIWLNWGNRPDRSNLPPGVLHVYDPTGTGVGIGDPLPANGSHVLEAGSWSAAVVEELVVEPGDIAIDKFRMSGFVDTELDSVLRSLDVSTVLFAGVNLDQCVFATLTEAAALGYDCVLLEDCSATTSPPGCAEAVRYNVAQCFGFVASSTSLLDALEPVAHRTGVHIDSMRSAIAHRISPDDTVRLALLHAPTGPDDTSVFLEIWDPGGSQPPNSHPVSTETFLILKGEGLAHVDGETRPVRAGDFVVLAPGSLHRIENTGEVRLTAITTMAPDQGFAQLVLSGPRAELDEEDLAGFAADGPAPTQ